jgi:hypothetical protein
LFYPKNTAFFPKIFPESRRDLSFPVSGAGGVPGRFAAGNQKHASADFSGQSQSGDKT